MNEFKPGDVVVHPEHGRGIVQDSDGDVWWVEFADRPYGTTPLPDVAADLRRLVVIDPEDRKQVERLVRALPLDWGLDQPDAPDLFHESTDQVRAALREFADPKPEEPTGLGAVVEDAEGKWVRVASRTGWWWRNSDGQTRRWPDIDAVRVLSEGVQP